MFMICYVLQVRYSFFKDGEEVAHVVFYAYGSTYMDWLSWSNSYSGYDSSFRDLNNRTDNYFSIEG